MSASGPEGDRHRALAAALGRIPSGLFILTATNGTAETGMLASWVQQCSFEPLQLSVALRKGREVTEWLTPGASFVLNVLGDGQTSFLAHFGKGFPTGQSAFTGLDVLRGEAPAPVLAGALAYLECRVEARHPAGDHELLLARLLAGKVLGTGQPMVHVRKSGLHY
jgi:flavin reductase (DIM6/NTAB) family NADH-FMN oxidoreductase RutF